MNKTGFIYLWYDKKHKRYYLGSHWGKIDDGYICSSNWMRDAYRRRPSDFKRRIIQTNIIRENLVNIEHQWLSKIKNEELGKKYYNLMNRRTGNWSHIDTSRLTVSQKISNALLGKKRAPASEERKKKISIAMKGRPSHNKGKFMSEEQKLKIGEANSKSLIGKKLSEEHRKKISESIKQHWTNRK